MSSETGDALRSSQLSSPKGGRKRRRQRTISSPFRLSPVVTRQGPRGNGALLWWEQREVTSTLSLDPGDPQSP